MTLSAKHHGNVAQSGQDRLEGEVHGQGIRLPSADSGKIVIPFPGVAEPLTSRVLPRAFWAVFHMAGLGVMTMMILGPRGPKVNVKPR